MSQAPHHPHHTLRGTFANIRGVTQPAPAPRFEDPAETVSAVASDAI
jgi:alpha-methylacyl-CoA racemase